MTTSAIILQIFVNILAAGGAYALVAAGYTIVHSTLRFINFQHGYMVALGAYFCYAFTAHLHFNFLIACALAIVMTALVGVSIERIGYKPLRKASKLTPLLVSLGFTYILQSVILIIWGPAYQSFDMPSAPVFIGGAVITSTQLVMVFLSLLTLIGLHIFLKRTRIGVAMRAVSDNMDAAAIMGINTDRVISAIFALASGLAAIAGILIGLEFYLQPTMGFPIIIRTLAAVTLGGIGSIPGAIAGSYIIAIVENVGVWLFNPAYRDAYPYLILVLALLFRSGGLFSSRIRARAA